MTSCDYSIIVPPDSQSFTAASGTGKVIVAAPEGCAWTAFSNSPFISITSGSRGNGNGEVNFSITANPGATARAGVLTIAGLTAVIRQAGIAGESCSFAVEPSIFRISAVGGDSAAFVNAALDTCEWSVRSNSDFIIVTSPDSAQTGSAFISFSVLPNPGSAARIGTITLAGQTFTVEQAGRPAQPKPLRSADQVPREQPAIISRPRTGAVTNKRKR